MFINIYKNSFKILIRDKSTVFWTVLFVILLAIMFKMTFSKLDEIDKFEAVPIAVNQELLKDEYFTNFLKSIEKEEYIELIDLEDKNIEELFNEKKIVAYLETEEKIIIGKGIKQINETIIKSLMDSYNQNKSMITNIFKENPTTNINELLNFETFTKDDSKKSISLTSTYFYTLIGMQALYAYIWGLRAMYMYEANLSTQGKRIAISPVSKKKSILASLLAAWSLGIITNLLCLGFISYILNIDIGNKLFEILLIILLGTLTGVSFGSFFAVSSKKSVEFKGGIGVGVTMLWSFFAGMMHSDIKILIERNIPILNKINPVALITDALYSLAINDTLIRFSVNIMYLLFVTFIFIIGTIFFVRGKKYASL